MSCKEYIRDLDRPPEKVSEIFGLSEKEGDKIIEDLWSIVQKNKEFRPSDLLLYAKEKYDNEKLLYAIFIIGAVKGYMDGIDQAPVLILSPTGCNPTSSNPNSSIEPQRPGLSM